MSVTDSLVKQFFETWFLSTERNKRNDDTWQPIRRCTTFAKMQPMKLGLPAAITRC